MPTIRSMVRPWRRFAQPITEVAEVRKCEGVNPSLQEVGNAVKGGGELSNYSPVTHAAGRASPPPECVSSQEGPHNWEVAALRSRPASIKPIRNSRTGSLSYRVTVTIRGKQRKRQFSDLGEAKALQEEWEIERTLSAVALRPKITRLRSLPASARHLSVCSSSCPGKARQPSAKCKV